jgi:CubicO group peptidase (beta-lactamase class C family)
MTKSFTAAALLLLRDEGALRLDDPIAKHVPELTNLWPPTADSPEITLRHLMTMSAGLPEDDAWADRLLDVSDRELSDLLRAGATFGHPPGVVFEYSNLGWAMLGRAIANVTGAPPQGFIRERLLVPLGLASTNWDPPDGPAMTGHRWQDEVWVEEPAPLADGGFAPMGGLWSTVADVARWIAWMLDAFPPRNDPDDGPLSRASRREMQQAHHSWAPTEEDDPGGYGYGLGVWVGSSLGHMVGHAGGLPGYGSHMRWLPERGAGAVVLANRTYPPTWELTFEILRTLDERGAIPAREAQVSEALASACDGLVRLLRDWNDELADALFSANVFLDEDRDRRRGAAEGLVASIGPFEAEAVGPVSDTRGTMSLRGERGTATVEVMLSPEVPPRILWYEVKTSATG